MSLSETLTLDPLRLVPAPVAFSDRLHAANAATHAANRHALATRFGDQARQAEAQRKAAADAHACSFQEGYVDGAQYGMLFGFCVGVIASSIVGTLAIVFRAWLVAP